MSDVPVCDVLLEAADYLSKLGNNLKVRSENLKEKRITKDKLKNTHAVQKAADKLLLICELSKKSLCNVELGVQKILNVCGVRANRQTSTSNLKPSRDPKSHKESKTHHIVYCSRKLRIKQKVNFKHYASAKVRIKKMSFPSLDKYPVYHDCKLYQMRMKNASKIGKPKSYTDSERKDETNQISTNVIESDTNEDNNSKNKTDILKKDPNIETKASSRSTSLSIIKLHNESQNNEEQNIFKSDHKFRDLEDNTQNKESVIILPENQLSSIELNNRKDMKKSKTTKPIEREPKTKDDDEGEESSEEVIIKKPQKHTQKFRPLKIYDDSSSDTETKKDPVQIKLAENFDGKDVTKENENSDSDSVILKKKESLSLDPNNEKLPTKSAILDDEQLNVQDQKVDKPMLKCIDITKLLKPDVVSNIFKKRNNSSKKSNLKDENLELSSKSADAKYWEEKRNEVRNFKAKHFKIKMYPDKILNLNNIKIITINGKTVVELSFYNQNINTDLSMNDILKKSLADFQNNDDITQLQPAKEIVDLVNTKQVSKPDVNQAKNALLEDSDSDKNSKNCDLTCPNENPNKALKIDEGNCSTVNNMLNEDDHHDKEADREVTNAGGTNTLEETKNNNTNIELTSKDKKDTDNIKCALLKDSSDDASSTPSQKTKPNAGAKPESKRKNIMESMHAKKMLLTYSSSSDTDDEKLKKALKDIKDSLLEGSDDNQSTNLKEKMKLCRKRLIASSSSDEEDINKKINKSQSTENVPDSINVHQENMDDTLTENISQVDGNMDELCLSKEKKMGRSKVKPNASSSQNSDTQETDKDIDRLTNLKTLDKRSQRRDSTSTSKTDESEANIRKTRGLPKAPAIAEDVMLEAESNSSGNESPVADIEDLPQVSLSGLNGGALEHLAKDDLLDDSDASSSHGKSSEENKNEDESPEEDNVKSKRRKANAISSDSEGVPARKSKDPDIRLSDFDDSDPDSTEPTKRNKRKKKENDSDSSAGSSDSGKKKRRRIKQVDDSDGSGSESETEGRKQGRKNIRKVMGKDQLEEATKKAARREKERVARIMERQRLYNNLQFDESGKPDEVTLEKVVLDFDPESKEPIIQVDRGLVKKLKPHQANGIKFMWDACFESVKRIKKDKGSGCILAHCMGLGKTLQVVSLTHTLLTHEELTRVRRVLVVCPLSTVLNWVNEFNMWLKNCETDKEVDVYELSRFKQNSERAYQLQSWFEGGGVCVLGYEMFRNLSADNPKKYRKKMLQTFQRSLVDPGPDLVVCDEGHLLKNEKTSLSQSMNRVKSLRRIVLTGTPLQNNLKEYYCMVQFVKPNLLGKYNEYLNRFVNPITNGQYTDSTEHDIRIMKRRSHVLHKMLDGAVQRRDYGVLAPFLPPKHEYVLFITLTDVQTKLYQFYLDNYSRRPMSGRSGFLFPDFQSLQRIWTHPLVLKYNSERYEIMQQKKRDKEEEEDSEGSLADFIDDDSTPDETSSEDSSDDMSDASDDSRKKNKKKKSSKKSKDKDKSAAKRRGTRANPVEVEMEVKPDSDVEEVKNENPTEWWIKLVTDDELDDLRNSHKLILLFEILRQCEAIGDKLLVFSQSLYSLDLIEHFLGKIDEATQEGRIDEKLGNHVGSWSPGVDYFRLDGSTSCENRSIWCKNFNREDNPRARLFLISTRAGGLGINLVAANRVVIFDVSWNPSHDVQSIFRVYRFGQKKPCYVYRFLAMGTMEEKIYERQVTKQAISKRVIDEQQIDRHYAENDLAELYKFEPCPSETRPLPPLPKDRLFAEMLKEHDKQIYKYHEHDSLLENKEEETLTEEERKAAWEDFENEKNRPPPAPFPNVWPMNNGMAPGLMVQQQQQLAYAALAAMLRKDMPNINENQIRDMLPMIYNANPALMQKMSDMYKYSHQMMNPMMAAASGGVGGSSGLQYEPPWQRQQQQQNQMRLQQLMQQNSMNAKYYAGGLGSRDPVAMALQQARARQMMSGDGGPAVGPGGGGGGGGVPGSRPRGRPPLTRPHTSTDVVNLDSD